MNPICWHFLVKLILRTFGDLSGRRMSISGDMPYMYINLNPLISWQKIVKFPPSDSLV